MANFSDFHNLFSLSKTLRFMLKPIGKTKENFEKNILISDEKRSILLKDVKTYFDEYYKKYIEDCLHKVNKGEFEKLLLQYETVCEKEKKENKEIRKIENELREKIADTFSVNKIKTPSKIIKKVEELKFLPNDTSLSEKINKIKSFENLQQFLSLIEKNVKLYLIKNIKKEK